MERKHTFDRAAEDYERYRPGHPETVFDDLIQLTQIPPPARILEIGCGPGQATLPLARRGYRVHAVELGVNLAERARQRLAGFPDVTIEVNAFEDSRLSPESYDLVFSASSFHWLDRSIAYPKIAEALRPGGALAVLWTAQDRDTPVSRALRNRLRPAYEAWAPELLTPEERHVYGIIDNLPAELEATGLFGEVLARDHAETQTYDARGYVRLLGTHSPTLSLSEEARRGLLEDIRERVDEELGGTVTLPMRTRLYVTHVRKTAVRRTPLQARACEAEQPGPV